MRIGYGYDAHRFKAGSRLVLGGVTIPFELGMEAHSDGDVVIHAICDALLGACALGDIGQHFPDTANEFKNIDSRILLHKVKDMVAEQGWQIANIDSVIVAQIPRLAPYIMEMRSNIAADLGISCEQVSVKATTTEKMGFTGRAEGIAVNAVALLIIK